MKTNELFSVLMVLAAVFGNAEFANAENHASGNDISIALNDSADVPLDEVYEQVDVKPQFPGGDAAFMKFISDNIKYPAKAQSDNVSGRVLVQFIIDTKGQVRNPHCVKSVREDIDNEAINVLLKSPRWTPAKIGGKAVNMKYTMPITFKLPKGKRSSSTAVFGIYKKVKNRIGYDEYVFGVKDKTRQAYKVVIDLNVATRNEALLKEIAQRVFGVNDDFEAALTAFRKTFTSSKIEEAKLSVADEETEYCTQANGVVGIEYRSLVGVNNFQKLPDVEHFLFDTKTNKVVTLEELITPKLNDYLKSNGIETDKSTNIYIKDKSIVAVTSLSVITMDGEKLKDNLSDYALETLGLAR